MDYKERTEIKGIEPKKKKTLSDRIINFFVDITGSRVVSNKEAGECDRYYSQKSKKEY